MIEIRGNLKVYASKNRFPVGDRVVIAIREEKTKIHKRRTGKKPNIIEGTVKDASFIGEFIIYEVSLINGDVINCKVPIATSKKTFSIGEKVLIELNPEDIMVYPYPPAGLYRELEAV